MGLVRQKNTWTSSMGVAVGSWRVEIASSQQLHLRGSVVHVIAWGAHKHSRISRQVRNGKQLWNPWHWWLPLGNIHRIHPLRLPLAEIQDGGIRTANTGSQAAPATGRGVPRAVLPGTFDVHWRCGRRDLWRRMVWWASSLTGSGHPERILT